MPTPSPLLLCSPQPARRTALQIGPQVFASLLVLTVATLPSFAQTDRDSYLSTDPLAEAEVQPVRPTRGPDYSERNPQMMYRPMAEDPLSFYVRTQDGEWQIPTQVSADDPWVRVLVLTPKRPTIADVAIDINHKPFRAAREQWIDKLLAEAKATSLVRAGEAAADAAGIQVDESAVDPEEQAPQPAAESSQGSAEGTSDESDTSEDTDGADEESASEAKLDEDDVPMVKAQRRQASSLFKRLINYLAADQTTAEREEVRWLLAEWTGGPALMTLSPAFAWRRSDAAPLWHALDLDGDQTLSSDEISKTSDTLKQADINRDEILSLDELERLSEQHASQQRTKGYPLVVVIDDQTDWRALRGHLRTAYPPQDSADQGESELPLLDRIASGDRSVSTADLANLLSLNPDLVYRVAFAKKDAKVKLLATGSDSGGDSWGFQFATDAAITVARRETYMELTAAQGEIDEENESGDMQQTQISIGAVADGYPLFRLLDHDNNRQLTLREWRNLESFLTGLDLNEDGQVESTEIPTAIRLAITHGPQSHVHLANAIAAQRDHGEASKAEAPDWFVGMDRNRDGDLSRREFQGSPRQFAKYDRDGDGLISRLEVEQSASKN